MRPGEIFREDQPGQPQPFCRQRIRRADGYEIRPKPVQDQAPCMTKGLHPAHHAGTVAQLARGHGIAQFGRELFPDVGLPDLSRAFGRGPLLQSPVRDLHEAAPGRIAGIGPAEAQIEQIFESIPSGTACRTGRIHIEAAQMAIGAADPAWRQQVDLKPAQMCVGRGKDRGSEPGRDPREGDFGPKTQRQIHGAARGGITRVEIRDIDISGGEGHHCRSVFQRTGGDTDSGSGKGRVSHEDFRRRGAAHEAAAGEPELGHGIGGHVFHRILRCRTFGILAIFRMADQHGPATSAVGSRLSDQGRATWRNDRSMASNRA